MKASLAGWFQPDPQVDAVGAPAWLGRLFVVFAALLTLAAVLGAYLVRARYSEIAATGAVTALWLLAAAIAWPVIAAETGKRRLWLLSAALVVVASRILIHHITHGAPLDGGDSRVYLDIAANVASGRGLVWDAAAYPPNTIFAAVDGPYRAAYPPLYLWLLAGALKLTGGPELAPILLNSLIDLGAAALILGAGARLGHTRAGWAAAYLYLIWPAITLAAPLAQKEGLVVLLFMVQIHAWLSLVLERRAGWRAILLFGAATGGMALTQPALTAIAIPMVLAAWPWARMHANLGFGIAAAGVALLALLPWAIRNQLLLGEPVLLTTSGGANLYLNALRIWTIPPEVAALPEAERMRALGEVAIDWIMANPLRYLTDRAGNLFFAFALDVHSPWRLATVNVPLRVSAYAFTLIAQLSLIALWAAAAAAAWRRLDGPRTLLLALVAACIVGVLAFNLWFEFGERHRVMLLPLLLLIATIGWSATRTDRDRV
jgi:4-amino-4-deoxy-L-arabinose transferase-like glycosyltransferase